MGRMQWQERIISEPDVHHGDPCIKGTRIPVAMILGSLADRMTPEEIRDAYPQGMTGAVFCHPLCPHQKAAP